MPTGASTFTAIFTKEGEDPPHVANGTLAIYINDEKVGEMKMRTQPGKFSIAGEGLTIGRGSGEPVTSDWTFARPWTFTGTVKQVPVIKDGAVVPGVRLMATLSADHRVTDGAEAAQFMQSVKQKLEQPLRLVM